MTTPEPLQGLGQRADGALAQSRDAVEPEASGQRGGDRHQKAEHRPGVAAVELGRRMAGPAGGEISTPSHRRLAA